MNSFFDTLKDNELVDMVNTQSSNDAMEELIRRHKKLYFSICLNFCKKNPNIHLTDLFSDIYFVFNASVKNYNPTKNTKFSTWMAYMARFHCLHTNRKFGKLIFLDDNNLGIALESYFPHSKVDVHDVKSYLFDTLREVKDDRIHKIFYYRFIEGGKRNKVMPFAEIGKKLKLSTSHVINLYEKGRKLLVKNKIVK